MLMKILTKRPILMCLSKRKINPVWSAVSGFFFVFVFFPRSGFTLLFKICRY